MSEENIKKLVSDICNAAAIFTMEYMQASITGVHLDHGLDSRIEPILRAALETKP
jgi:hypothetical protein